MLIRNRSVAIVSSQGGRSHMEDVYSIDENFIKKGNIFGGVYDGHGNSEPAKYAAENIPEVFALLLSRGYSAEEAMVTAYEEVSKQMSWAVNCGTCAANFLVRDGLIHHANAGDSRIMVVGKSHLELTTEHRITNKDEILRIRDSGGRIGGRHVYCDSRGLMPTRSLGDQPFKKIGVLATPSVGQYKIQEADRFLVAGTDGLFDEVNMTIIMALSIRRQSASVFAQELWDEVLHRDSVDNLTIMVIKL